MPSGHRLHGQPGNLQPRQQLARQTQASRTSDGRSALVHIQTGSAMKPLPACTLQASKQGEGKSRSKLGSELLACATQSPQPAGVKLRGVAQKAAFEHPSMCLNHLTAGRLMSASSPYTIWLCCAQAVSSSETMHCRKWPWQDTPEQLRCSNFASLPGRPLPGPGVCSLLQWKPGEAHPSQLGSLCLPSAHTIVHI